jgi:ABC-2 type transport system ATP-binding protein
MSAGGHRGQGLATVLIGVLALGTLTTGLANSGRTSKAPTVRALDEDVTVPGGPTFPGNVRLKTTLYLPATATPTHPAPAVIVSPGFGQTKASVATDARDLAAHGYIALAWTMRGFNALATDAGKIALDAPDAEVADLRHLIDRLAQRKDVLHDSPQDPRVGLVGGSYGGGVSLLGAALDARVDATVPVITWNSLESALLPGDVFKAQYAAVFFGGATGGGCQLFAKRVCTTYQRIAQTGRATAADHALLRASSPGPIADRIKAPTLLIQGENDTLFPLSESLATADALRANGTHVQLAWVKGGHDASFGTQGEARIRSLTASWMDRWLRRNTAVSTGPLFQWDRSNGSPGTASTLPPLRTSSTVGLTGQPDVTVTNPAGGRPASISSVPGVGALGGIAAGLGFDIPGQSASWQTPPLGSTRELVGAGELKAHVTSRTGEAVLFVKVFDVAPDGSTKLPGGQVAPVRLTRVGGPGRDVTLRLPTLAHVFPAGNRIRVGVATTDLGYAGPLSPASYEISLRPATALVLPLVTLSGARGYGTLALVTGLLLVAVLAVGGYVLMRRHRRPPDLGDDDVPPVVITGLAKSYADGFRAVDGIDLVVERGQVLGLLGPNGAGKTTTLRMLAGLIRPSAGEVRLFGRVVTSGSPVLSRVGLFIEGPGLLPHLTGMENLTLYWTSTAPSMAGSFIDEALEIAGLGDAVHRPVRTYSHGMKQRLAIAQAMLGRPDLLVLDEPTNGLDPPQIKEVREVLRAIAATGRTVVISSHLLAEVEQTCSHVAIMSRGKMVAQGTVDELLADGRTVRVEVDDQQRAVAVLRRLSGVADVVVEDDGSLVVALDGASRGLVVSALVEADVAVLGVASRRHLEDVFLELLGTSA